MALQTRRGKSVKPALSTLEKKIALRQLLANKSYVSITFNVKIKSYLHTVLEKSRNSKLVTS